MRRTVIWLLLLAMSACVFSCRKQSGPGRSGGEWTVGVVGRADADHFWRAVHAGVIAAGRELDVEIIYQAPASDDDKAAQVGMVRDMIARQVDGIVVAPLDYESLRPVIADARRRGIPAVLVNHPGKDGDCVSSIITDQYVAGYTAGQYLKNILGMKGKVAVLRCEEGSPAIRREEGFCKVMGTAREIEMITSDRHSGSAVEAAGSLLSSLIGRGDPSLVGVFCPDTATSLGMLEALRDAGIAGKVKFVGFGRDEELAAALRRGEIDGLAIQSPLSMGFMGVRTMVRHLDARRVSPSVDIGVTLATQENMDTPTVANRLDGDLSRWFE